MLKMISFSNIKVSLGFQDGNSVSPFVLAVIAWTVYLVCLGTYRDLNNVLHAEVLYKN